MNKTNPSNALWFLIGFAIAGLMVILVNGGLPSGKIGSNITDHHKAIERMLEEQPPSSGGN